MDIHGIHKNYCKYILNKLLERTIMFSQQCQLFIPFIWQMHYLSLMERSIRQ